MQKMNNLKVRCAYFAHLFKFWMYGGVEISLFVIFWAEETVQIPIYNYAWF